MIQLASILDTDLYKFSTSNFYFQLYPLAEGIFKFHDRRQEDWREHPEFLETISECFNRLTDLFLSEAERDWAILNIPYISPNYWEWLQTFRYEPKKIKFWLNENGAFECETEKDKMYKITLYEIAILPLYAEVRNYVLGYTGEIDLARVERIIREKLEYANENNIPFSEFGTRRRFSLQVHKLIIESIKKYSKTCVGTSNVHMARVYGMTPSGTYPHENVMFHAAIFGYKRANYLTLEDWIKVYDGYLGTALVDTYTTNSFLRTLTRKQALLLSGFRQDSGDEVTVGENIISRLKEFDIDPTQKLIIFSNALDFPKAKTILDHFKDKVKVGFGIGTNLTCDPGIEGYKPANIVMKLSKCRLSNRDPWENCIKISDDQGKHMGDNEEFELAVKTLKL